MRDSCIFYRSFYEALKDLPIEEKAILYDAIFDYSLNFNEPILTGLSKTVFTLIKPQIEANIKRYHIGTLPKEKRNGSETEAKKKLKRSETEAKPKRIGSETEANKNVNDNVNDNDNNKKELLLFENEDFLKFKTWVNGIGDKLMKMRRPFTEKDHATIKANIESGKYTLEEVRSVLEAMQNKKTLIKDYESTYLTFKNWMANRKPKVESVESSSSSGLKYATLEEFNKPFE